MARKALEDGPVASATLLSALEKSGLRRVEIGDLWEILVRHGVATLEGDEYVPRGWAESSQNGERLPHSAGQACSSSAIAPDERKRPSGESRFDRKADVPTPAVALELQQLAKGLGLTRPASESVAVPPNTAWIERANEFATALRDELHEATQKISLIDVPVEDGRVVGRTETATVVRFQCQGEVPTVEGGTALLICDGQPSARSELVVDILCVYGAEVTLAVPGAYPHRLDGRLRCDLTWLLAEQRRRMLQTRDGVPGFNPAAALALSRPQSGQSVTQVAGSRQPVANAMRGLNQGQQRAVDQARHRRLTWLWGPPGTGKTTTVAAIAQTVARLDHRRVLLVAPTNVALDVALTAILGRFPKRRPGEIVRIGAPVDVSLVDRSEGVVLVDEVAAIRGSRVAKRRVEVAEEARALRAQLRKIRAREPSGVISDWAAIPKIETRLAEIADLTRRLDDLLQEIRRQVCRDATIVAATAHQVYLGILKNLSFDTVIIDEASMLSTSLASLVAGKADGHTIVAGDFRQLGPVTIADTASVRECLKQSPFEASGTSGTVAQGKQPVGLISLTEQYRMRSLISDSVSSAFYRESPLVTADSVRTRSARPLSEVLPEPLVLIDTSSLRARVSRRQGHWSRLNIQHAQLVASLVRGTASDGAELALTSPFGPQARLLEALVAPDSLIRASTVHRFQGSESDTVIFDTVDTNQSVGGLHPWFAQGALGSEGARLINVAASRAREQLIVVADLSRIAAHRERDDAVGDFLRILRGHAQRIPWQQVVNGHQGDIAREGLRACIDTLTATAGPAEMFAPAVDADCLSELLSMAPSRRLETLTLWLPPETSPPLVKAARDAGVMVHLLTPIRESLLVSADTVLTASGSLLQLSTGVVLTTRDPRFADAVRRLVRRRDARNAPGSGKPAESCSCGRLLVRHEVSGHRAAAWAECPSCCAAAPNGAGRARSRG